MLLALWLVSVTGGLAWASGGSTSQILLSTSCTFIDGMYVGVPGSTVQLTAQLSGAVVANQSVTFSKDGATLATVTTDAAGAAQKAITVPMTAGVYSYTATAAEFGSDQVSIVVGGHVDGVSLAVSPTVTVCGTPLTITATLAGYGGLGYRVITLTLYNAAGTQLSSTTAGTNSNGVATFTGKTAPGTAGEYTYTASYESWEDTQPLSVANVQTAPLTQGTPIGGPASNKLLLKNPSTTTYPFTIDKEYKTGYTYLWWVDQPQSNVYVNIVGGKTGQTVTLKPVHRSDAAGDVKLKVNYYKNGVLESTATRTLTVIKPVKANCVVTDKGFTTLTPGQVNTKWGFYRELEFIPKDQFGNNIQDGELYWEEHWYYTIGTSKTNNGNIWQLPSGDWGGRDLWGHWSPDKNGNGICGVFDQKPSQWGTNEVIVAGTQHVVYSGWDAKWAQPIHKNKGTLTWAPSATATLNVP